MSSANAAYISCGTWGLVGVELADPIVTDAARAANFTNEGGVDGRVRFLHNVTGLWLLSETVREWSEADDEPVERAAFARTIVESIAAAFAEALRTAGALSGRETDVVHLVGGGSLNRLLCQATADRAGVPVLAGPVEATALGNVLVQARAHGWFGPDATLETLRAAVTRSFPPTRYDPR